MIVLGALAVLVFAFALVSRRLDGTAVTAPMGFVAAGLVAGWTGFLDLGGATVESGGREAVRAAVFLVAEVALVLLLFTDAARIDPGRLRGNAPFLVVFLALAAAGEGLGGGWARFALEQIGYGALIGGTLGAVGGWALRRAAERGWALPSFEQLGLAALAVATWFVADAAGGNGFIAAFVGGAAAGRTAGALRERVLEFAEEEGHVLNLAIFFLFGVFAATTLGAATARIVVYGVLSLTVVRMVPVAIALAGQRLPLSTIAFLGWFGPRGLASIILGFVVVEEQPWLTGLEPIAETVTVTVLLSVFAHGITAAPATRAYALQTGSAR